MPPKKMSEAVEPVTEHDFSKFTSEIKAMLEKSESKISGKLKKLDDKFSNILQELRDDISGVRDDVEVVKTDVQNITTQIEDVEKSIDFHAAKVDTVEKEQEEKRKGLDDKIEELNKKLLQLEKHDRKYNLIFHGIEEERNEKLYERMRVFFVRNLKIDEERAKQIHFTNGHRLPADSTKYDGPKPVIMRFSCYEDRELVLSQAFNLAGSRKMILTDLPVVMKKERQRLAKIAYNIRQNEDSKTRIRDKGLDMVLEVRKDKKDPWVVRKA